MRASTAHRAAPGRPRQLLAGLGAAALLALAGCAVPPVATPQAGNGAAIGPTQATVEYQGRFSISYNDSNGTPRNAYGNFDWRDHGAAITLELRNPLGQTLARIESTPEGATLALPNQALRQAPDASTLMRNMLGFELPVDDLKYWLNGKAAPSAVTARRTDPQNGRLSELRQDGWTVTYAAYAEPPSNAVRRVDLSRDGDDPPLSARLVIDP